VPHEDDLHRDGPACRRTAERAGVGRKQRTSTRGACATARRSVPSSERRSRRDTRAAARANALGALLSAAAPHPSRAGGDGGEEVVSSPRSWLR